MICAREPLRPKELADVPAKKRKLEVGDVLLFLLLCPAKRISTTYLIMWGNATFIIVSALANGLRNSVRIILFCIGSYLGSNDILFGFILFSFRLIPNELIFVQ
uniref:Uncharacterized protein n=1 Tax=Opuntia streptacantha TaxID=393608 RepID=A0A7C9EWG0_OPUST